MRGVEDEERRQKTLGAIEDTKRWLGVLLALPPRPSWVDDEDARCVSRTLELLDKAKAFFESR
jgi:hypothetical protein